MSKDPEEGRAELGVVEEVDLPSEVVELLSRREAARLAKDFSLSDKLRDELRAQGFEVKDTPEGQQLSKA